MIMTIYSEEKLGLVSSPGHFEISVVKAWRCHMRGSALRPNVFIPFDDTDTSECNTEKTTTAFTYRCGERLVNATIVGPAFGCFALSTTSVFPFCRTNKQHITDARIALVQLEKEQLLESYSVV